MKKIKILFILPKAQAGGAERQLLYLINGLDREKFQVYLGYLYRCEELKKEFEKIKDLDIIYFDKKASWDISVYFKIAKFIRKNHIDIVHSFMGSNNAYLPAIIARPVIPVGGIMSSFEDGLSTFSKFERFRISKFFTKHYDLKLVSCSYSGMKLYLKKGFSKDVVSTIPNGIDYQMFSKGNKQNIDKEFHLQKRFVLGTIGRLIDVKNHQNLIKMFYEISKKDDNITLLIVGNGPLMRDLERLVVQLQLEDRVILTGNRNDIPDLLARINIFVFPSLSEGWPNAVGEAMSAGVPVVTFDVGDISYVIKNNHNGIITENNMHSMKNAIKSLMTNKDKMKVLGMNEKKTIKSEYSVENMVKKYESFYIETIKQTRDAAQEEKRDA